MAADNKAKFDVIVDIDVTTGKVDVTSLLKRLTDTIAKDLAKIQAKEVDLPIEFNLEKEKSEIRAAFKAVKKKLDEERLALITDAGKSGKGGSLLKGMLGNLTKDEKIAKGKLRQALRNIAGELNLPKTLKGDNPLAPFLKLSGKTIDEAKAGIKQVEKGYELALNNIAAKSKEAAVQQKNAFANLSKSLDTNIANKAVKTTEAIKKITAAVATLQTAQAKLQAGGIGGANDTKRLKTLTAFQNKVESTAASLIEFRNKLKAAGGSDKDLEKLNKAIAANSTLLEGAIQRTDRLKAAIDKKNAAQKTSKGGNNKELSELDNAISRVTAAQERLNDARSKTKTSRASGNAAEVISSLKAERAAVLNAITAVERQIAVHKKSGKSAAALTLELRRLNKAAKGLERDLRGPTKTMLEFANSLKTFVRFAVAFKVLGGISRGVRALVGNVVELDDALVSVKTIANATAEEMIAVENAVKNVATTTQFTTTEIAQAAQVLAQAGVGPESIASTLSAVANFAAATNASLQVASDLISTIQNVFKELAPEEIADKLTNAVNISKLTATGLQTIFSRLAQTAKSFNLNFDQVLGAAAVLKNVGIKDSTISTGFRQGLLELLSPDDKTLKVLEKRYKAVGETMSQSAISSLFSSFKSDANPLLRVLDELEKLGIQGSGAEDFERLFDVRASNVINALIDNKEQFVKNTEAINRTGAAAKGAKTQLESLSKGADNLVAVVSTLAADLSGPLVDSFKDIVTGATEAANSLRDVFNAQKELTGSSGLGASLELGVAAGGAAAAKGLGAGKAVIAGLLTAGIATAVNATSGKGQGVTESATKALSTVLEVVATLGILRAFFPAKEIPALESARQGLAQFLKNPKNSLKTAFSFITAGIGKLPVILGAVIGSVVLLSSLFRDFFDSSLEKTLADIEQQRGALGKKIEDDKAAVADAEKNLAAIEGAETSDAAAGRKLGLINEAIQDIVGTAEDTVLTSLEAINEQIDAGVVSALGLELQAALEKAAAEPDLRTAGLNTEVQGIFSRRAGVTKDVGSEEFDKINTQINEELAALGVKPVSALDTVKILTQQDNLIAEAEGRRQLFTENLTAALANSTDPDNKEFLKAWEALSVQEKARYATSIDEVDGARQFLGQISEANANERSAKLIAAEEKLQDLRDTLSADQLKDLNLQVDSINAAKKAGNRSIFGASFDEMFTAFSSLTGIGGAFGEVFISGGKGFIDKAKDSIKQAKELTKAEINKGKSKLTQTVESGLVEQSKRIAEALLKVYAISIEEAKTAVDAATANAEAVVRKEIKSKIKSLAEGRRVATATTPFDERQDTSSLKDITTRDKQQRKVAVKIENDLKDALDRVLKSQLEAVGDEEKLTALKKQRVQLEGFILDQANRVQNLGTSGEKDAQKIKQIKQGFLFEELRVKELTKQIGEAKALELRSEEKFTELLTERLALEEQALVAQKQALTQSIKNELERQGKGGFEDKSLGQILEGIQSSQLLAGAGYEDLAGLVKEAVLVQDKLNQASERYTNDLDNYLRKDLNSKLSKAQSNLASQQSKTKSIEGKLSTATSDLAKSREDLAKLYDDQAENERFFDALSRSFKGEEANQAGDARDLNKRAREASTPEEQISLAKEAATLAKTLFDEGAISQSQGERTARDSQGIVNEAEKDLVNQKNAEIARNQQRVTALAVQHAASLASEKALQGSVEGLKASIDGLAAKIKEAMSGKSRGRGEDPAANSARKTDQASKNLSDAARNTESKLTTSAGNLNEAAASLRNVAGRFSGGAGGAPGAGGVDTGVSGGESGTVSFIKDIGKNTADVAAGNTTRLTNLKNSGIDPDSALAKSILKSTAPFIAETHKAPGFSVGGMISGPGNGTDDQAGLFALSNKEFVQPSAATEKYGTAFMEQIRSLKFPVEAVRGVPAGIATNVGANQSGAEAVAKAAGSSGSDLRPVTFNFEGAKLDANAASGDVASFRKSLSLQALKTGTRQ